MNKTDYLCLNDPGDAECYIHPDFVHAREGETMNSDTEKKEVLVLLFIIFPGTNSQYLDPPPLPCHYQEAV